MYSSNNNVIIHKAVLICNLSAAMTPCNYEQTVTFYSLLKYQMFNLTCDSILKYMDTMLAILNIAYPNIAW